MKIETMTPQEAVERMRDLGLKISIGTMHAGLQQGVYPFGVCIQLDKSPVYQIYTKKFEQWLKEVADE